MTDEFRSEFLLFAEKFTAVKAQLAALGFRTVGSVFHQDVTALAGTLGQADQQLNAVVRAILEPSEAPPSPVVVPPAPPVAADPVTEEIPASNLQPPFREPTPPAAPVVAPVSEVATPKGEGDPAVAGDATSGSTGSD